MTDKTLNPEQAYIIERRRYGREWAKSHPENIAAYKERNRAMFEALPAEEQERRREATRAYQRAYRNANRDRINAYQRARRAAAAADQSGNEE